VISCSRSIAAFTQDTPHRFGVFALRIPPDLSVSGHLAPFALRIGVTVSLAGRDSGDYYEASVAIELDVP